MEYPCGVSVSVCEYNKNISYIGHSSSRAVFRAYDIFRRGVAWPGHPWPGGWPGTRPGVAWYQATPWPGPGASLLLVVLDSLIVRVIR